jgi:hypothetical protein
VRVALPKTTTFRSFDIRTVKIQFEAYRGGSPEDGEDSDSATGYVYTKDREPPL